jgi:hypothetical protein
LSWGQHASCSPGVAPLLGLRLPLRFACCCCCCCQQPLPARAGCALRAKPSVGCRRARAIRSCASRGTAVAAAAGSLLLSCSCCWETETPLASAVEVSVRVCGY